MACIDYAKQKGLPLVISDAFKKAAYDDGLGCIAASSTKCTDACKNPLANPKACYNCLSNPYLCAANGQVGPISSATPSCCPLVASAIQCSRCTDVDGACFKKLSAGALAGIIVGSIVGVALIILIIVLVARNRSKKIAREDLVDTSRVSAVDPKRLALLSGLDVDTDVLRQAESRLSA